MFKVNFVWDFGPKERSGIAKPHPWISSQSQGISDGSRLVVSHTSTRVTNFIDFLLLFYDE